MFDQRVEPPAAAREHQPATQPTGHPPHQGSENPGDIRDLPLPGPCALAAAWSLHGPIDALAASVSDDLTGIHDVMRIQSIFDGAHYAHSIAVLRDKKIELAITNAVLTCTGAIHRQCTHDHALM